MRNKRILNGLTVGVTILALAALLSGCNVGKSPEETRRNLVNDADKQIEEIRKQGNTKMEEMYKSDPQKYNFLPNPLGVSQKFGTPKQQLEDASQAYTTIKKELQPYYEKYENDKKELQKLQQSNKNDRDLYDTIEHDITALDGALSYVPLEQNEESRQSALKGGRYNENRLTAADEKTWIEKQLSNKN